MTRILPLLLIIAVATPALAEPSANDWLRVGLERYERGNLIGAVEAFERGYAMEPRPMFLFALGQAHRKRGDCERARASFDAFLATSPPAAQADAARDQRERCEPPAPATVAEPEHEPAPPAAAPPPPAAPRTPPWWSDRVALGAGGAAVVFLGAGGGLWLSSRSAAGDAAVAGTYDQHRALRERAESRQLAAGIALGVGAAATAVTVWRLTRDRSPERTMITPAVIAGGGAAVIVGGRF